MKTDFDTVNLENSNEYKALLIKKIITDRPLFLVSVLEKEKKLEVHVNKDDISQRNLIYLLESIIQELKENLQTKEN